MFTFLYSSEASPGVSGPKLFRKMLSCKLVAPLSTIVLCLSATSESVLGIVIQKPRGITWLEID